MPVASHIWCHFFNIYWLCYYSCPISTPSTQLHPAHPLPPTFPPYSSCPWVILISSLASTFPTLFLPSPCLFNYSKTSKKKILNWSLRMKAWSSNILNNFLKLRRERGRNPTCVSNSKGPVFLLHEGERALIRLKTWFLNTENVGIMGAGGRGEA